MIATTVDSAGLIISDSVFIIIKQYQDLIHNKFINNIQNQGIVFKNGLTHYCLKQKSNVLLKLYSIQGQFVYTIVDSWQSPQDYTIKLPLFVSQQKYILTFQTNGNRIKNLIINK